MATASYANVIKTAGIPTAFTGEAFTLVNGTTYQINDATKRIWDRSIVPTIKDGGVVIPAANIKSYDYLFGMVTLASAPSGAVTADGNYLPMSAKTSFRSYRLTCGGEVGDNTTFDNNGGFVRRQHSLHDVTAELGGFQDPWFFAYTDCAKNTAGEIDATTDPVTFNMEAGHGLTSGAYIRIEDEILLITNVNINAITAARAQWGSVIASHALGKDVFTANISHYSRNAFLVEFRPGGSAAVLFRGWFVVENQEHSGALADLEQNTVSILLDGAPGAAFGRGAA